MPLKTSESAMLARLSSGPPRGLGATNTIVNAILHVALERPDELEQHLEAVVSALRDERPLVTTRAANALDKLQRNLPAQIARHSRALLTAALNAKDLRTRWNLIEVIGRLPLTGHDRALAIDLLFEALSSASGFLRAFALTGLVQHAQSDARLQARLTPILTNALQDPSPAVRARARKLCAKESTAQKRIR